MKNDLEYRNAEEVIKHHSQCLQNNDWENFNFQSASYQLIGELDDVLCDYGQNDDGKEGFVTHSLDMNFPGWTTIYAGHYGERGYGMQLAIQTALENGNFYCMFEDPLSACEELETRRFHELEKQYKNNPDILNLIDIYSKLTIIDMEDDIEFSQEEMIEIIINALHAKHPNGAVFNLEVE